MSHCENPSAHCARLLYAKGKLMLFLDSCYAKYSLATQRSDTDKRTAATQHSFLLVFVFILLNVARSRTAVCKEAYLETVILYFKVHHFSQHSFCQLQQLVIVPAVQLRMTQV